MYLCICVFVYLCRRMDFVQRRNAFSVKLGDPQYLSVLLRLDTRIPFTNTRIHEYTNTRPRLPSKLYPMKFHAVDIIEFDGGCGDLEHIENAEQRFEKRASHGDPGEVGIKRNVVLSVPRIEII